MRGFAALLAAAWLGRTVAKRAAASTGAPRTSEVQRVQSAVVRVAHFIDAKRWADLRSLYADEVDVDYTSLFGGEPQKQTGDELVGGWQKMLGSVTTHHLLGPVDVTVAGSTATAECHVNATHQARGEEWVVAGHYLFALNRSGAGWRIVKMNLVFSYERGTRKVLEPPPQ